MGRSQPSIATRGRTRSEGRSACPVRTFRKRMAAETARGISTLTELGLFVAGLLIALPAHAGDEARPLDETHSATSDDEVRRKLLLANLPEGRGQTRILDVFPAVYGALFLTSGIASAVDPGGATKTQTSIFVTTNGVLSAAAFGTYLAPRPLRAPLLTALPPLWFSGLALTLYCDPSNSPHEDRVLGIAAGTGLVAGTIPLLDALIEPPADAWALETD
ncbi:MAG TPA: hypothetical protein VHM25_24045, partial [Polyangiaceae bacterium]|nr:hypothetical protein [Polyangiaceae bacterium]